MKYPNFNEEKKLWKKECKAVVGLDEAGRGPLAGPVVAAAVMLKNPKSKILNPKSRYNRGLSMPTKSSILDKVGTKSEQVQNSKTQKSKRILNLEFSNLDLFGISNLGFWISGIKDSKQLSPKKREQFYDVITTHPNIKWGIGKVSEKIIDEINILEATKLAMIKAVANLNSKSKILNSKSRHRRGLSMPTKSSILDKVGTKSEQILNPKFKNIDYLLIDGNFRLNIGLSQKSIIKGDQKVISISAASIIAKVSRDRIMERFHKKYPQYRFDKHKGYPTKLHIKMLKKFGSCPIHRKSFYPVKKLFTI
ncbi:ribonuclease HII [Patescibacteria group bacterium]|nr:ribonuclease HII [Patescibacteria group bacterium]